MLPPPQEDVMCALMSKWITQALLLGQSNFATFAKIQHHATSTFLSYHGSWSPSSLWLFSLNFSIKGGSKVWHHIAQLCKVMAMMDTCSWDILQLILWWRMEYQGLMFGNTMDRDHILY